MAGRQGNLAKGDSGQGGGGAHRGGESQEAAPGVITLQVPAEVGSANMARALARKGIEVAWQSRYLRERNWLQIALMGEIDEAALRRLPALLSALLRDGLGARG